MLKRTVLSFLLMAQCLHVACQAQQPKKVRPPAVAGSFYPADPKELDSLMTAAQYEEYVKTQEH